MERLEVKKIKGKTYYYYSKWGRADGGRCRRIWQRYLGTAENILKIINDKSEKRKPIYAEVFQFGLSKVLWQENEKANVIETVDRQCKKRQQGLSLGKYISIAAINRAISPVSKLGMWEWFSATSLVRELPEVDETSISAQQFWNHMDKISIEDCQSIWKELILRVLENEKIDLSSISYDGTNYYTFIDTFNTHCSIAKRGKNKQGRANLRQISYALFCAADGHIPLLYDVYDGNKTDVVHFPEALKRFKKLFTILPDKQLLKKTTLIFDKGNNSEDNFKKIDKHKFYFVTSSKLDQHKELTSVSNNSPQFAQCKQEGLESTKTFRVNKTFYGKERTFVVSYNTKLFNAQWQTLQADIQKAIKELSELQKKLDDRLNKIVTKGKKPSLDSIKSQCKEILHREYLKDIITITYSSKEDLPKIEYEINQVVFKTIIDTYLGKNIIVTNRSAWTDEQIVTAYRSQYIIEGVFKESKDRKHGTWWPQYHWTDSKIHVHALYCTIALLLRAVMLRKVQATGMKISMPRLLTELVTIKEVVNVYETENKKNQETVLTKCSDLQEKLLQIFGLNLKSLQN